VTGPGGRLRPEETAEAVAAAEAAGVTLVPRARAGIEGFFTGLDLVDRG
jgi:hypothetical protein